MHHVFKKSNHIMRKTNLQVAMAALLLASLGCRKEQFEQLSPEIESTESFRQIEAPADFSWNTARTIQVQFTGRLADPRRLTLKISGEDGSVLYRKLQNTGDDAVLSVEVPAFTRQLTVQYGSFLQTYPASGNGVAVKLN